MREIGGKEQREGKEACQTEAVKRRVRRRAGARREDSTGDRRKI